MMNQKNNYSDWLKQRLFEVFKSSGAKEQMTFEKYLEKCCFFHTMTFKRNLIADRKRALDLPFNDHSVEHQSFLYMYHYIEKKLFGAARGKSKILNKMPMAFVCIDYEGSKYAQETPNKLENIHIHSVWAIHPSEIDAFNKIINGAKFQIQLKSKLDIDANRFDKIDPKKLMHGNTGSYVCKAHVTAKDLKIQSSEMIRIYPDDLPRVGKSLSQVKIETRNRRLEKIRRWASRSVRVHEKFEPT